MTTFTAMLDVTLGADNTIQRCQTVSTGRGIYFGLAQAGRRIYVAERNLDINRDPVTSGLGENLIRMYLRGPGGGLHATPLTYGAPDFDDLHQIAHHRRGLFVTSGKYPFLLHRALLGRGCLGVGDLTLAIPPHLRRTEEETRDAYHFNSVSVDGDDLLALAHNWDQPSFALRLSVRAARKGRAEGRGVYENLGQHCHDIVAGAGATWVLDSGGANLVRIAPDGTLHKFPLVSPVGDAFPRGLAVLKDRILVAYGLNSAERSDRMTSQSMLAVFDLAAEDFVAHVPLGAFGNTCAVMAI